MILKNREINQNYVTWKEVTSWFKGEKSVFYFQLVST
jgi:hypothetical protein